MCKQKTRISINTNGMMMRYQQAGFSLVMVMMIMVVIALLVIAGAQVSNTEMRISTNNADQKFARGVAEKTLLEAEKKITEIVFDTKTAPTGGASANPAIAEADLKSKGFEDGKCGDKTGLCGAGEPTDMRVDSKSHNPVHVWEFMSDGKSFLTEEGFEVNDANVKGDAAKAPRYVVEYLGVKQVDGAPNLRLFRVTARAWGKNINTVSTLQTVVVAPAN